MLTAEDVKNQLTTEDIIHLLCDGLGSEEPLYDAQNNLIFNTCVCHGGDSFKLYFYPETKMFYCYTQCNSMDLFTLVQQSKHFDTFREAFDFVVDYFHIENFGFTQQEELTSDWDVFQKIDDFSLEEEQKEPLPVVNENMLEYFYPLAAPTEWQKEGIKAEIMLHFGIRVDSALEKIVIPHRDINGKLIGIRGRSYNPFEVADGKKYMPVFIEGTMYNHPLGRNLYGLYENQDTIRRTKKVLVCESEKSVLQCASFYGADQCFCVATCGSNISQDQVDLLLSLGVQDLILGYDADQEGGRGETSTKEYEQKLLRIVTPFLPYVNVSIIFDYDHILPHKASPTDCGQEKFEILYDSRVRIRPRTENKDYHRNKR